MRVTPWCCYHHVMTKTRAVNLFKGEPYDTYMGGPDDDRSPIELRVGEMGYLGNPFKDGTPECNFEQFKEYFLNRMNTDPLFRKSVVSLRGSRLGCLRDPDANCHASFIAEYINTTPIKRSNNAG